MLQSKFLLNLEKHILSISNIYTYIYIYIYIYIYYYLNSFYHIKTMDIKIDFYAIIAESMLINNFF